MNDFEFELITNCSSALTKVKEGVGPFIQRFNETTDKQILFSP